MDLKAAVSIAKQQVNDLFAPETPQNVRVEEFLYDDHLGVWSLTIGFALPEQVEDASAQARRYKIIRVSEAGKSVLSVKDR
ncbi:MAG: hypothetical protein ACREE2_04160 [Stellaceae bacterium]